MKRILRQMFERESEVIRGLWVPLDDSFGGSNERR
jgi:hypothetical protein